MVLIVCASGFEPPVKSTIESQVLSLGGHFSKDLTDSVNLLICKKAKSDKYSMCKEVLSIPVVTHSWLEACVKRGRFLEEYEKFRLKPLTNVRLFLYNVHENTKKIAKKLGATVVKSMQDAEITVTDLISLSMLPRYYAEDRVVGEHWLLACKQAGKEVPTDEFVLPRPQLPADRNLFLSKCIIYLNVSKDEIDELKVLIANGGGTWAKTPMRCVTHIVANHRCDAGRAFLVNADWLRLSVKDEVRKDEKGFPVKTE